MLPSAPMTRTALFCLFTLGLVACATPLKSPTPAPQTAGEPVKPATTTSPAETSVEAMPADAPVDLVPVPFATARADFVRDTAAKYGIAPATIEATLAQAQFLDSVVSLMSRPAERVKPWSEYRPIFITASRIEGGRAFLATHRDELQRVQARTGVPAEIIVAIIGVETSYGGITGKYPRARCAVHARVPLSAQRRPGAGRVRSTSANCSSATNWRSCSRWAAKRTWTSPSSTAATPGRWAGPVHAVELSRVRRGRRWRWTPRPVQRLRRRVRLDRQLLPEEGRRTRRLGPRRRR